MACTFSSVLCEASKQLNRKMSQRLTRIRMFCMLLWILAPSTVTTVVSSCRAAWTSYTMVSVTMTPALPGCTWKWAQEIPCSSTPFSSMALEWIAPRDLGRWACSCLLWQRQCMLLRMNEQDIVMMSTTEPMSVLWFQSTKLLVPCESYSSRSCTPPPSLYQHSLVPRPSYITKNRPTRKGMGICLTLQRSEGISFRANN